MPHKTAHLAKLTRPTAEGLIDRPRLFQLLDKACHQRVIWVSSPAGAGKTSLITSYIESRKLPCLWYQIDSGDGDLPTFVNYISRAAQNFSPRKRPLPKLTAEYLAGLETFIRHFFRSLFERLLPPAVLIFDNFNDVPADSPLYFAIAKAMEEIPPGNTVIFISRYDPPPTLVRTYSSATLVEWEQLKLTDGEAGELLHHFACNQPGDAEALNSAAQGWIAGLILLARSPVKAEINLPQASEHPQLLYDYFAQEILSKIPETSHGILMKTSLFPSVTPQAACALTELTEAGSIIATLHRERFFIDRHIEKKEIYTYHPLFRAFLLRKLEERYSKPELLKLKNKAAQLLEESSQPETAIDLYLKTENWDDVSRLIAGLAFDLLAEGRYAVLKRWLDSIPLSLLNHNPKLLYWLGMSRMPFNPAESRVNLETAFNLFKSHKNISGLYLTLSALLSSYYYEWSDFSPVSGWLTELEMLMEQHPDFPSILVEAQVANALMAVLMYCPQHPLIKALQQRVVPLIRACSTSQQKISVASPALFHWLLSGDFAAAEKLLIELKGLLDVKRISPTDAIMFKILESIFDWKQAAYPAAIDKLEEAHSIAQKFNIHFFDSYIATHLCLAYAGAEQLQNAVQVIKAANNTAQLVRKVDVISLKFEEIALDLKCGLANRSHLELIREMIRTTQEIATPYYEAESRLLYSQALVAFGGHESAKPEFIWLKAFAETMPSPHIEFRTRMVEANSAFLSGDHELGVNTLTNALAIGAAQGYLSCHPIWYPNLLPPLFAKALELDIEPGYVRQFIRARTLKAPSSDIENWPWPIRLYTLGRFSIFIDDQLLRFEGKAQKKPLELIKCLIANGGQGVSQALLAAQLWPDLEGDAARNACDLALHRLRKLLQKPNIIAVQDGKLGLDTGYVWVDAWAFERLCSSLHNGQHDKLTAIAAANKLLNLYSKHFLDDEEEPWAISYRERLNSKLHRSISHLTRLLSQAEEWDEAISLYQKAIEIDPLAEQFHYGLMRAYQVQGRITEALTAYRHCHDMLSIMLGVKPSAQIQAIYQTLKSS